MSIDQADARQASIDEMINVLAADPAGKAWLARIASVAQPVGGIALPERDALPGILLDLSVPHEAIDPLVRYLPSAANEPGAWWLLERTAALGISAMGVVGPLVPPSLPAVGDPLRRYWPVYVLLAMLPHVRRYHLGLGIGEHVSRRTLGHLGRSMALYRQWHGVDGLDPGLGAWLSMHFRGLVYDLGRLHFERARIPDLDMAGPVPVAASEPVLSIHMPGSSGPLTPASCDQSLTRARTFFPRHFPGEPYRYALCHSWLLDPQLAEYLPEGSNIVQFQRRFEIVPGARPNDADTLLNVFGRPDPDLDAVPQETALQRAIVAHLKAGRHWTGGVGWLALDALA